MNVVDHFLTSYLGPEISTFKEAKHDTQNGSLQTTTTVKIVTSQGLHVNRLFANYFEGAPVVQVPGRLYPIELQYVPHFAETSERSGKVEKLNPSPYLRVMQLIDHKYPEKERGDMLVFMSGMAEIAAVVEAAKEYAQKTKRWIILPLHSSLSIEEQDKVFDIAPEGVRKCIVSTNIAETSITIDGIRFIVDSGKVKEMNFDAQLKMQRLQESWISKASAEQRKGRAGRTGPGVCFRLYAEEDYNAFAEYSSPEIQRVPLDALVLQMASLGLRDATAFPFIEPPSKTSIENAIYFLKQQNALTEEGDLTSVGKMLARLPVDVVIGKMLIMGTLFDMIEPVLIIAAALSVQSPLTRRIGSEYDTDVEYRRRQFESEHGDPFTLLHAYDEWIDVKSDKHANSRKWCRRRRFEEQRFYEISKLKRQFEDLLRDHDLMKEDKQRQLSRHHRSEEDEKEKERLLKLKRQHQQAPRKQKLLKLDHDEDQNDSDEEEEGIDIHDIQFKLTHNLNKLQQSSSRHRKLTLRDTILLKLIICSGLYPQVAIPDESNPWRKDSEQIFHSKQKQFLGLHPTSVYSLRPQLLSQKYDQESEDDTPRKVVEGQFVESKEILAYVSLLETNKAYIMNAMRIPALQTLLLLSRNLDTNSDCTRIICDDWLEMSFDDGLEAQDLLSKVVQLRSAWGSLLEMRLAVLGKDKGSADLRNVSRKSRNLQESLAQKLAEFVDGQITYRLRRVHSSESKYMYTTSLEKEDETGEETKSTENPVLPEYFSESQTEPHPTKGGTRVNDYLTFGCVRDALTVAVASGQAEYLREHYHCPKCGVHLICTVVERLEHDRKCGLGQDDDVAEKKVQEKGNEDVPSTSSKMEQFRKPYFCLECDKEYRFTTTETLKHKLSHR